MKTLMLMMLMLITVDSCSAMPTGVNDITPVPCCFEFFTGNIPPSKIITITKTHDSCINKAFVVTTAKGNKICVRETWVHKVVNRPVKA